MTKKLQSASTGQKLPQRLFEGLFILSIGISIFLTVSLLTYHASDPAWSRLTVSKHILNAGGRAGAYFADVFLYTFGYFAYVFPLLLSYGAWLSLGRGARNQRDTILLSLRVIGAMLILAAGCGLLTMRLANAEHLSPMFAGGMMGDVIASGLIRSFSAIGSAIIMLAVFLLGLTLFTGISWSNVSEHIGRCTLTVLTSAQHFAKQMLQDLVAAIQSAKPKAKPEIAIAPKQAPKKRTSTPKITKPVTKETPKSDRYDRARQAPLFESSSENGMPSISLLDPPDDNSNDGYSHAKLELMSRDVEQKLLDFGIEVQVVAVHPGPVITRFEMQLAPGVKASKISVLAKDLARSLSVQSVRVVEVIAGKSVVGLELPNAHRETVRLSEVLASAQYDQARSALSLALGKDIAGHPVIVDLAKMPHLLVAGTTGSGKSVSVNAMLLSFLYKATPSEVRMILIDPKMLELSVYDGIPHLLTPVVTDPRDAAQALRWCVAEMERRYRLMSATGVRNLAGFNKKVTDAQEAGEPLADPLWKDASNGEAPLLEKLPYIVVVIDELADLMMVVGKKVEQLIARIAQKARASGIHMILATQRPSVDVLTGLIKSNIPTRMSFQVSSKVDSRTILDQMGAESLLGMGDMLYLAPGTGSPMRVHGAYVADDEVKNVTEDWKSRSEPSYLDEVLDDSPPDGGGADAFAFMGEGSAESDDQADQLFDEAVRFVTETRRATISSVQRKFKIGYNRAARLIEDMERHGIVSKMETNGSREVLAPPPPEID